MNYEINENDAEVALMQHGIGNPMNPVESQKALMKRVSIIANYRREIEARFEDKIYKLQNDLATANAALVRESDRLTWLDRQMSIDETKALFLREDIYTGDIRSAIDVELMRIAKTL